MTNVALYFEGSNEIKYFFIDAVRKPNAYVGSNAKISSSKLDKFRAKWTSDIAKPIYDDDNNKIGYDKKVSELTEIQEKTELKSISEEDYRIALKMREFISDLDYDRIEQYIDNSITDLASAKEFLKKLSKVVLALSKIQDKGDK